MAKVLKWKDIEKMDLFELAKKRVPVTYSVYIQLAKSERERELRLAAVEHYINYENCVFYANGSISNDFFEICSIEPPHPEPLQKEKHVSWPFPSNK